MVDVVMVVGPQRRSPCRGDGGRRSGRRQAATRLPASSPVSMFWSSCTGARFLSPATESVGAYTTNPTSSMPRRPEPPLPSLFVLCTSKASKVSTSAASHLPELVGPATELVGPAPPMPPALIHHTRASVAIRHHTSMLVCVYSSAGRGDCGVCVGVS